MTSKEKEGGRLLAALEDPESARLVGDLLEGLRRLSGKMGGAQPVIDALAQSFALMGNAEARSEYDQSRLELIRYLESLDDGESLPGRAKRVELKHSPDASARDLGALSELLSGVAKAPKAKG